MVSTITSTTTALNTKSWFVIYSPFGFGRPKQLYRLEIALFQLGVEFSYPCLELGVDRKVLKPLFDDYAFIRCVWNPSLEQDIIEAAVRPIWLLKHDIDVSETIPFTKRKKKTSRLEPVIVPDSLIRELQETALRLECDASYKHELLDELKAGEPVRFIRGSFESFIGKVIKSVDVNEVLVEITILGRQVQMLTSVSNIERL